jgi:hypothetical protein
MLLFEPCNNIPDACACRPAVTDGGTDTIPHTATDRTTDGPTNVTTDRTTNT